MSLNDSKGRPLFRCFSKRSHADQFLSGRIRFGYLQHYRNKYEGQNGPHDGDEGTGLVQEWRDDRTVATINKTGAGLVPWPGYVNVQSELGNQVYICCFTDPPGRKWKHVMKDFGKFVVRISDRQKLLNDIHTALNCNDRWQRNEQIALHSVEYSKGTHTHMRTDMQRQNAILRLSIAQKRPEYAYQFEYRIALISSGLPDAETPPDHICVNIGHSLKYATLEEKPRRQLCARWGNPL